MSKHVTDFVELLHSDGDEEIGMLGDQNLRELDNAAEKLDALAGGNVKMLQKIFDALQEMLNASYIIMSEASCKLAKLEKEEAIIIMKRAAEKITFQILTMRQNHLQKTMLELKKEAQVDDDPVDIDPAIPPATEESDGSICLDNIPHVQLDCNQGQGNLGALQMTTGRRPSKKQQRSDSLKNKSRSRLDQQQAAIEQLQLSIKEVMEKLASLKKSQQSPVLLHKDFDTEETKRQLEKTVREIALKRQESELHQDEMDQTLSEIAQMKKNQISLSDELHKAINYIHDLMGKWIKIGSFFDHVNQRIRCDINEELQKLKNSAKKSGFPDVKSKFVERKLSSNSIDLIHSCTVVEAITSTFSKVSTEHFIPLGKSFRSLITCSDQEEASSMLATLREDTKVATAKIKQLCPEMNARLTKMLHHRDQELKSIIPGLTSSVVKSALESDEEELMRLIQAQVFFPSGERV